MESKFVKETMIGKTLLVWVTSWNRPHLLEATLNSITKWCDVPYDLAVVDNESSPMTEEVIVNHPNVKYKWLLGRNKGINWPIENLMPTILNHEYIMICDHDLHFTRPLSIYISLLQTSKDILIAKGLDSPEHQAVDEIEVNNNTWLIKKTERGGGIVLHSSTLVSMFPLPKSKIDFDVHLCEKMQTRGKYAVLPKACIHAGWEESTWKNSPIPEKYILVNGEIIPTNLN